MMYFNKFGVYALLIGATLMSACTKDKDDDPTTTVPTASCFQKTTYTTQLPNFDFEEWGVPAGANNKYEYPCGGVWSSSSGLTQKFGGVVNAFKTTDAQQGAHALKMETKEIDFFGTGLKVIVTGGYFAGSVDLNTSDPTKVAVRGVPFTERPVAFKGFYKYAPVNGDSALIEVTLRRYDATKQTREIVGYGSYTEYSAVAAYVGFNVPIAYNNANTPDTLQIDIYSSKIVNDQPTGEIGSVLFVDNCEFTY